MIKISELLHQKEEKYQKAHAILVRACDVEKRNLTPEEDASYKVLEGEIRALVKQIEEETRSQALEMESVRSSSDLTPPPGFEGEVSNRGRAAVGRSYRSMFGEPARSPWESRDEFFRAVGSGRADPRLQVRTFTEGDSSEGGLAVPEELTAWMLDSSLESEIVRPRATVWPMSTATRKIPGWDLADHTTGNLYGGMEFQWLAEGGTATRKTGKLRSIVLNAKKAAIYTSVSRELSEDGLSFEQQLQTAMPKSLAFGLDSCFLTGTGAGQPLGVLNDPALITVAKETNQLADTILYESITKMWSRLLPSCANNAVWLANPTTIPELLNLGMVLGTSGSPLFIPSAGVAPASIFGRPLILSEKMPTLGDAGDVLLVDLSFYQIGLRKEVVIDRSNAPGWLTDTVDYRCIIRIDGMGGLAAPVTPKHGSTLSWCVAMGERA